MIGHPENLLDTRGLLQDVRATIVDHNPSFYIGSRINRNSQLGSRSYMAFYKKAIREVGNYGFVVDGVGIKPSDPFVFYRTDTNTAFSSMKHAYEELKTLKTNCDHDGKEVIGSLIFSCCSRGVPQL
ncbi:hypothetical protein Ddye_017962 [Dipteronia dyeriana]|uniref:Uncharacterized protein n=1 Tax=Dipteronia dyeriana TaxID=168575 RepID=A0AAD9UA86_9ROSI|nr:hypothetical protein Ddye_017962 [Dipteronia dyeriana]